MFRLFRNPLETVVEGLERNNASLQDQLDIEREHYRQERRDMLNRIMSLTSQVSLREYQRTEQGSSSPPIVRIPTAPKSSYPGEVEYDRPITTPAYLKKERQAAVRDFAEAINKVSTAAEPE